MRNVENSKPTRMLLRLVILSFVFVGLGFVLLAPKTSFQLSSLFTALVLLSFLPNVIESGLPKIVEGGFLGLLLGLPVAVAFNFLPFTAVFATFGCALSCFSVQKTIWKLTLSTMLAVTAMFASICWVYSLQISQLNQLESSVVQIQRSGLSFSPTCTITISINSDGEYELGDNTTKDYSVAVEFLENKIETLLASGAKPEDITIVGVTPHNIRHDQKIWMLREAFENVQGKQLHVRFDKSLAAQ